MFKIKSKKSGFTLIELLVVISIIGLLSSVVLTNLQSAKIKAYDARRKQDLKSIYTAYSLYNTSGGTQLTNYGCGGACQTSDSDVNFLSGLITAGALNSKPKAPNNAASNPYMYYDYGPGNPYGFMIVTQLEGAQPTMQPYPGSCRPFTGATNWCDTGISSTYYCLCYTY